MPLEEVDKDATGELEIIRAYRDIDPADDDLKDVPGCGVSDGDMEFAEVKGAHSAAVFCGRRRLTWWRK
jgi:hypothetical protein